MANVDRINETRRRSTRSRTPSRIATPQVAQTKVEKAKPAKKKGATTRARSKTPTRVIASTPKPKPKATPKATPAKKHASSSEKGKGSSKKRKSVVLRDDSESDFGDDTDYHVSKKTKSPKTSANATPSTSKQVGRPRRKLSTEDNRESKNRATRASKRIQELNSIKEESRSPSRTSRDLSNGGLNQSNQDETLNETQANNKWGWFSCAIM